MSTTVRVETYTYIVLMNDWKKENKKTQKNPTHLQYILPKIISHQNLIASKIKLLQGKDIWGFIHCTWTPLWCFTQTKCLTKIWS